MSTSTSPAMITTSSIGGQKKTLLMLSISSLVRPPSILKPLKLSTLPGAGGKNAYSKNDEHVARNEAMGMELQHFTDHYGFSYFSISNTEIEMKFVGADGATMYQYTRGQHKSGSIQNFNPCLRFPTQVHRRQLLFHQLLIPPSR